MWLANESDETGQNEVYMMSFAGPETKRQISSEGGSGPVWTKNGGDLIFRNGNRIMAVPIQFEPLFSIGKLEPLFEIKQPNIFDRREYYVSTDGQMFVLLEGDDVEPIAQIKVVLNWFEELKHLARTKK